MVDQVQPVDQTVARLIDGDLPVVAAQAKLFVVLGHEHVGLLDVADVVGLAQAVIQRVPEVAAIPAIFNGCKMLFNQLPELVPAAGLVASAVVANPLGQGVVMVPVALLADLAAHARHQCRAEGLLVKLTLATVLFQLRMDVVADVVTGQELDAVGQADVEGQAVDIADRGDAEPGEQRTMFFLDPSGNPIEIKGFKNLSAVFAS